jgi:hypothetical protein
MVMPGQVLTFLQITFKIFEVLQASEKQQGLTPDFGVQIEMRFKITISIPVSIKDNVNK